MSRGIPKVVRLDGVTLKDGEITLSNDRTFLSVPFLTFGAPSGLDVQIVEINGQTPLTGKVGEIWVSGDAIASPLLQRKIDSDLHDDEIPLESKILVSDALAMRFPNLRQLENST
jgi:hypothetical protein